MAVNNAPLVETDFSTYYITYGYHHTFYHDLPEFTGAEKRMKEQPRQIPSSSFWLTGITSPRFSARTKIGMCNDITNMSRHTDSTWEIWYSSARQNIH